MSLTPLDVSCPDCKVRKQMSCVYIQPKQPRTGSTEWMYQRAGLPTARPHNGRVQKVHYLERAEREKVRRDALRESPERASALRANAEAVAAEQHDLIAWLRQHAHIFTT